MLDPQLLTQCRNKPSLPTPSVVSIQAQIKINVQQRNPTAETLLFARVTVMLKKGIERSSVSRTTLINAEKIVSSCTCSINPFSVERPGDSRVQNEKHTAPIINAHVNVSNDEGSPELLSKTKGFDRSILPA